jgi:hypothetical protein
VGRLLRRHLPVVVFAVLALVIAAVGVAFGGSNATTPKTVKRIVTRKINGLAPGLSVAHAGSADSAVQAANATEAANAARVNGANVCAGTMNVSANDEDHPLCENGPLIVSARCNNTSSTTEGFINVSSTRADAWAFGTATDGATVTSVDATAARARHRRAPHRYGHLPGERAGRLRDALGRSSRRIERQRDLRHPGRSHRNGPGQLLRDHRLDVRLSAVSGRSQACHFAGAVASSSSPPR